MNKLVAVNRKEIAARYTYMKANTILRSIVKPSNRYQYILVEADGDDPDTEEEETSILDFGCGSGRDAKYFRECGYEVTAIDGSEELCKIEGDYAGIPVNCMLFQELDEKDRYDGIWACSAILHLSKDELKRVIIKMAEALKSNEAHQMYVRGEARKNGLI